MRHAWILVVAAGCSADRAPTPRATPPADAQVAPAAAVVLDAAPPPPVPHRRPYTEDSGFDFRMVRLDPDLVGVEQVCLVGRVQTTEGGAQVLCRSPRADSDIELTAPATAISAMRSRDVLRIRIDGEGAGRIVARATLIEKIGRLEDPPPPSRCCRDRGKPEAEPEKPPPPPGYDFAGVWSGKAWNTKRVCEVVSVGEVMRSSPDARAYSAGSYFDASVAPFVADVWCGSKTGTEEVVVGSTSAYAVLRLAADQVIEVKLTHAGSNQPTALFVRTLRDAPD